MERGGRSRKRRRGGRGRAGGGGGASALGRATTKYSEHKTLDKLFELLSEKNDRWVETFMGKYGRILLSAKGDTLELKNMKNDHGSTIIYLKDSVECLRLLRDKYFNKSEDSDLSNIFDEIFSDLNRACYLLTLD